MNDFEYPYAATAYNKSQGGMVTIIIYAKNAETAVIRYGECINRHSCLEKVENPEICIELNIQGIFEDLFTEEMFEELNTFNSVAV